MSIHLNNELKAYKMANDETAHLVSMANDIAANLRLHVDADERISDHIKKYWTPRMRGLLLEYADSDGGDFSEYLQGAVQKLRD
jgi:hypothetical protein